VFALSRQKGVVWEAVCTCHHEEPLDFRVTNEYERRTCLETNTFSGNTLQTKTNSQIFGISIVT
jgi:hypothetical protein